VIGTHLFLVGLEKFGSAFGTLDGAAFRAFHDTPECGCPGTENLAVRPVRMVAPHVLDVVCDRPVLVKTREESRIVSHGECVEAEERTR
jgi:hypothetical protein